MIQIIEDTKFEDAESYSFNYDKNKLTFKDIVLLHLKKIGDYTSVEFRGGYWEVKESPVSMGGMIHTVQNKIYIPDSREVYSNSIGYLADILYPYFDEEMKQAFDMAKEEEDKVYEDTTIIKEPDREDQNPEEAKQYKRKFSSLSERKTFRSLRVKINRRLFRSLCCFLFRKKYLEIGALED